MINEPQSHASDRKVPAIIVGIGMPGAGKTTFLKPLAEKHDWVYVNRDDIRIELFNDALAQTNKELVWGEADRRVLDALTRGQSVIYDATFAESTKRRAFITHLREMGWKRVIGFYANTPPNIAIERNWHRDRVVPESELDANFIEPLAKEPPALTDGFDELYTFETADELVACL